VPTPHNAASDDNRDEINTDDDDWDTFETAPKEDARGWDSFDPPPAETAPGETKTKTEGQEDASWDSFDTTPAAPEPEAETEAWDSFDTPEAAAGQTQRASGAQLAGPVVGLLAALATDDDSSDNTRAAVRALCAQLLWVDAGGRAAELVAGMNMQEVCTGWPDAVAACGSWLSDACVLS
jgi:hypothetical protein